MGIRKMALHFSVQGKLITDVARERFYYYNDLAGAMDLLCSSLQSDDITPEQQACLALAILDGRKEIVGCYPGDDYGVRDVPEEERPKTSFASYFESICSKLAEAEKERKQMSDKLACIAENLTQREMEEIDRDYRSNYADPEDHDRTIFGTSIASHIHEVMSEAEQDMVDSFIARMSSDCEEPDYGWLFPDGTFYGVEFGDHNNWAHNWLRKNDPKWKSYQTEVENHLSMSAAGDYLVEHYHAVLLHNPGMGIAKVTAGQIPRLTKAQKEFLFDYYTKRGLSAEASKFFEDD